MRFEILSRKIDGRKIYINPEKVCAIYPKYKEDGTTIVQFAGSDENYLEVIESVDSVASMMEYE